MSVLLLTIGLTFAYPAYPAHAAHAATLYSKVGVGMRIEEGYANKEFLTASDIQCALLSYVNGIRTLSTQEIQGVGVKCSWLDLTFDPQVALLETSVNTYTIWSTQAMDIPTKTTAPPRQPATNAPALPTTPAAPERGATTPAAEVPTSPTNHNVSSTTKITTMTSKPHTTTTTTEPATKASSITNPTTTSTTVATTTPMQMDLFLSSRWVDDVSGGQAVETCAAEGGVPASLKYKAQVDFLYKLYDIDGDGVWVELRRGLAGTRWYDNTLYRDTELSLVYGFHIEDPGWGDEPRNCHRLTGFFHFKVLNCLSDSIFKRVVCARVGE